MGIPLLLIIAAAGVLSLIIILLYLAILWEGTQSIIANRNTYYSNGSNKYKEI